MLDINLIREKPQEIQQALSKRMAAVDFTELLRWDVERRKIIAESDDLKAGRNKVSSEIPRLKKQGKDTSGLIAEMKKVAGRIKNLDTLRSELDRRIQGFLEVLPNIPEDDVPSGGKENNKVIRVSGGKREFGFVPKDHMDLVGRLGLIDYERGVKLGGNGFWLYRGRGAVLEWALLNYFIEEHRADGYEFILPPHILTYECGFTAGQFPKFEEDVFLLGQEADRQGAGSSFLLPTAETALSSMHRDEVLREEELPKKYFAYTPCYRREAGSYRTNERGMIRGHQFNKVEIFQYTLPEVSDKTLVEMLEKAERLVKNLGLHYRVSLLAAMDASASMARTYDIEVWMPSIKEYKEVCSASNATDYQARRGNMRFKRKETGNNEFLHTLNASGLATSRILPALCEQLQNEDGSVPVPDVLKKWTGFDIMEPV
jgi:seryl-tRNA synthetase